MSDEAKDRCTCVVGQLKETPFHSRALEFQVAAVSSGRPTPNMTNLVKSCTRRNFKRHFKPSMYTTYPWLTGCDTLARVFCWPCMLFRTTESRCWVSHGYSDLNNLHTATQRHDKMEVHIKAVVSLKDFEKKHSIRKKVSENLRELPSSSHLPRQVKLKRKFLKRLILLTSLLCSQETVSHVTENEDYEELPRLLAKYDVVMKSYLESEGVFLGSCNKVQTDVIKCTSNVLLARIKEKLKDAQFVGLLLNVQDVSGCLSLSTVVRFVGKCGNLEEFFMGYTDISKDSSASFVEKHVQATAESLGCSEMLVSVIKDGYLTPLIPLICGGKKEASRPAQFDHGFVRELQTVLTQSLIKHNSQCKIFFGALESLSAFISRPGRNLDSFNGFVKEGLPEPSRVTWSRYHRQLVTVWRYRSQLLVMMENILDDRIYRTTSDISAALMFIAFLKDFTSCFLLTLLYGIFERTGRFLSTLQTKHKNIQFCMNQIVKVKEELLGMKRHYDARMDATKKISDFKSEPKRKCKAFDPHLKYRHLHDGIFDIASKLIEIRFENVEKVQFLELLDSSKFVHYTENFPTVAMATVDEKHFNRVFVRSELNIIARRSGSEKCSSPRELLGYLLESDIADVMPQLASLCSLAMTVSSMSPRVERRSRKLKMILAQAHRNTNETSSSMLISIENQLLTSCLSESSRPKFCEEVISEYFEKGF